MYLAKQKKKPMKKRVKGWLSIPSGRMTEVLLGRAQSSTRGHETLCCYHTQVQMVYLFSWQCVAMSRHHSVETSTSSISGEIVPLVCARRDSSSCDVSASSLFRFPGSAFNFVLPSSSDLRLVSRLYCFLFICNQFFRQSFLCNFVIKKL